MSDLWYWLTDTYNAACVLMAVSWGVTIILAMLLWDAGNKRK